MQGFHAARFACDMICCVITKRRLSVHSHPGMSCFVLRKPICSHSISIARDSGIGSTVDDHQHLLHRILDRLDSLEERISGLSNPHIPLAPPLQAPEDDRNDQQSLGKVRPHTGQPVEPSHILASDSRQVNLRDLSSDKAPHSTWWKATLEDTLEWPVLQFRGNTKRALEATMIYEHKESELYAASEDRLYDKKVISHLVELFIEEVHTKNPILEISQVQKHTAHVLKTGIGHDMETCFVVSKQDVTCTSDSSYYFPAIILCVGCHILSFLAMHIAPLLGKLYHGTAISYARSIFCRGPGPFWYSLEAITAQAWARFVPGRCVSHVLHATMESTRNFSLSKYCVPEAYDGRSSSKRCWNRRPWGVC